jgi:hypothetical protein
MKKLILLVLLLAAVVFSTWAPAQTNRARMISGVNYQTSVGSYAFTAVDSTRITVFNNASQVAATLSSGTTPGFEAGNMFSVINQGAGPVVITCPSGCTLNSLTSFTITQGQGLDLYSDGVNYAALVVNGSAGALVANSSLSINPPAQPFIGLNCDPFGAYLMNGLGQISCITKNGASHPNLYFNSNGDSNQLLLTGDPLAADTMTNGQYWAFNSTTGFLEPTSPGQVSGGTTNAGCIDVRNYLAIPFNPAPETEDLGLAMNKAMLAVLVPSNPFGTDCVDLSTLVPSANGFATYGNRLFANTDPWKGLGNTKNPDIRFGNSTITTSAMWETPQGGELFQGVPSTGTVNTGGSLGLGSQLSMCNDSGGCGPNAYPRFTTAAGCLLGSMNCYPVAGPWTTGQFALPAVYNTGQVQIQSNANTAQCGLPANSNIANTVICGASGSPVFASTMVGGLIVYNCTANTCTAGSTAAYSVSRITTFLAHGASFPTGGGTCTEVSGTGGCLITEAVVQGGTNLTAAFLLYSPNLPVALCDGCLGNAINNFIFGHVWRDFGFDVNGVSGGLGYLGPSVQERTEYDDVNITLQGQQTVNNAAAAGCASWGGVAAGASVVATHWSTSGVIGCSTNSNATSNIAGGTYGEVVEGYNVIKGTVNGCPAVHNFGTIVGQSASKFWDSAWVDGCTLTGGTFFGPHTEFYSNDAVEVGALHPVTGVIFIGTSAASNNAANAVIEFDSGTASNVALSVQCGSAAAPLVKDDTLTTPAVAPCITGSTATMTLTKYFQPGGAGGNSFPVSYAVTPLKLTGLTANQALTTIYTTNSSGSMGGAGTYRVCYAAYTTTAGTANTDTVQVFWNAANGGTQTFTSATWALGAVDVTGQVNGCQIIHAGVSTPIKVGTANGTYAGGATYALEATVEQLQGTP